MNKASNRHRSQRLTVDELNHAERYTSVSKT